jgi:hypothetical protein
MRAETLRGRARDLAWERKTCCSSSLISDSRCTFRCRHALLYGDNASAALAV